MIQKCKHLVKGICVDCKLDAYAEAKAQRDEVLKQYGENNGDITPQE